MFENNNESHRQRSHSLPISHKLGGKLVPKAVDGLTIKGEDVLQSDEYRVFQISNWIQHYNANL